MPFPREVRDQALAAAARYCCVCHRYKGVKVEVHHIVPGSRGGTNDLNNAIALCFDCHTDAGHYNPGHPRGTKFSPEELRLARDMWYETVRRGPLEPQDGEDALYCRYLVCKNFEAFREVSEGDLSRFPVGQPLLATNDVSRFHAGLVVNHPTADRGEQAWGEAFDSRDAYGRAHPNVRIMERSRLGLYPYFEAVRQPSIDELRQRLAPSDVVTRLLVEGGVPAEEISLALAYSEACAGDHFQEVYRVRPLWALYLAMTNLLQHPVTPQAIICESDRPEGLGYRRLIRRLAPLATEEPLPAAPIPAGATAVVPLATLLAPLEHRLYEILSQDSQELQDGPTQTVSHADMSSAHASTALIGPGLWPQAVRVIDGGNARQQQIHEFNLSNLYVVDRTWQAGSCPHLFELGPDRRSSRYTGELFARQMGITQSHRVQVPYEVTAIVIAELESELTIIDEVRVNGSVLLRRTVLKRGESVRLEVTSGDEILIVGRYEAGPIARQQPWLRNDLIRRYINELDAYRPP